MMFDNSHMPCLSLIITLCATCGERKIWSNIKKPQNIMTMIAECYHEKVNMQVPLFVAERFATDYFTKLEKVEGNILNA